MSISDNRGKTQSSSSQSIHAVSRVCHDRTLVALVYDAKARKMALAVSRFDRLVNDVRTLYLNRDPKLLELIHSVEAVEKMVSEDLKKAA